MKIPWYICIATCTIAFGTTYWVGTKKYDFVTSPNNIILVNELINSNTEVKESYDKITHLLNNLPSGAGYDTFNERADLTAEDFLNLAAKLVDRSENRYASLALERVLDLAAASDEQRTKAYQMLKNGKFLEEISDVSKTTKMKLCVSIPEDLYSEAERHTKYLAFLIGKSSGRVLEIDPEVQIITSRSDKPRPPISVWLEGVRASSRSSFQVNVNESNAFREKLYSATFNIVSPALRDCGILNPIEDRLKDISLEDHIVYLITRFGWIQFGEKLSIVESK